MNKKNIKTMGLGISFAMASFFTPTIAFSSSIGQNYEGGSDVESPYGTISADYIYIGGTTGAGGVFDPDSAGYLLGNSRFGIANGETVTLVGGLLIGGDTSITTETYGGETVGTGTLEIFNGSTVDTQGDFYLFEKGIINIYTNGTLNLAKGKADAGSLITSDDSATINKTSDGELIINGSMSGYTGTLNVEAGSMYVNNGISSKDINISSGAYLYLNNGTISGATSSPAIYNQGSLSVGEENDDRESYSFTFSKNTADYDGPSDGGAAIFNSGSIDYIYDVLFYNNSVYGTSNTSGASGGAIYSAGEGSYIGTITGDFIENIAIYEGVSSSIQTGGAIYLANSNYISASNSQKEDATEEEKALAASIGTISATFSSNKSGSGGAIHSYMGVIDSIADSSFDSNIALGIYGSDGYYDANGGAVYINGFAYNGYVAYSVINSINNTSFVSNKATSSGDSKGGAISLDAYSKITSIENNSKFESNEASYGGAIFMTANTEIGSIVDTTFNGNIAYASGGAIMNEGGNITSIEASIFAGNQANYGGAIWNSSTIDSIVNTTFTNNQATYYGGAILNYGGTITISSTEGVNLLYTGNSAPNGGFLFVETTSSKGIVNFNTAENSSITIGNGSDGYDSIASWGDTEINKDGDGELTVNSSMASYTGSLSVNEGTMTVNNVLGATSITIKSGATLTLGVSDYMATESTLLTGTSSVSNSGTLNLVANVGANEGDYYTSTGEITFTNVYGGTLSGSVFTVAAANEDLYLDYTSSVTISAGSRVAIASDSSESSETSVYLAFSSTKASGTLNSVSDESTNSDFITAYTAVEGTTSDIISGAYYFDFEEGLDVDSVLVSLYVGEESLSVYDFTIYHSDDGSTGWAETSDVSNVSYDGEYLSFEVTHFSGFGYSATPASTAVPEPSTYALIIGLCSLGFVAYRRRK